MQEPQEPPSSNAASRATLADARPHASARSRHRRRALLLGAAGALLVLLSVLALRRPELPPAAQLHAGASADAGLPTSPAKQRLSGERRLSGRVFDDQNKPLAEAEVRVSSLDDQNALPWTALSDKDGRFAFDQLVPHALIVEVSRAGHDAAERALRADDSGELTFSLPRQGELLVTVRDTPGHSVEGTVVTLTGPGLWPALELRTDAHGEARFEHLAFGEYRARARRETRAAGPTEPTRVVPGQRATLAMQLDAALSLTVAARDATTHVALADVEMALFDATPSIPARATRSDAQGSASWQGLLPGRYRLELRRPGYAAHSADLTLPEPAPTTIELLGEAKLSGQVVDEQGRPIAGAFLSVATREGLPLALDTPLRDGAQGAGELGVTRGPVPKIPLFGGGSEVGLGTLATQSDESGNFSIAGLTPLPIVLRAGRAGYAESATRVDDLLPHEQRRELRIVLRAAGRVDGVVRDARGRAVAGVYVTARGSEHAEQSSLSDASGAFSLRDVLGDVTVTAEPQGYAPVVCKVHVEAQAAARCELSVGSTLYELPVRTVDEFGFGLDGVVLTLSAKGRERSFTQVTRRDGSALLRELPEPPYQLEATLAGFVSQTVEVSEPERELRIRLVRAGSLGGTVTDSLGHPVPNALVSTDEGDATTNSDAHGNFLLSGIAPGALYVLAAHPQLGESVSAQVRARGGETLSSLRLVLPGRYLPSAASEDAGASLDSPDLGETVIEPRARPSTTQATSVPRRTRAPEFELSQRGGEVFLSAVLQGSAMERAGARAGDVLVSVDGEAVLSAAQGRGMLRDPRGHHANVRLMRDKSQLRVRYKRPPL